MPAERVVHRTAKSFWPYLVGPLLGAVAAAGVGYILRGPGGDPSARRAAQGTLDTIVLSEHPLPVDDPRARTAQGS